MNRFYRALLRLYPAGFRSEYEHELLATFEARAREHSGALAPLLIAFDAITDAIPNAIGAHWDILVQDLRYAVRSLGKTPGFVVTAVLVIALGVGANTAAFSLADFVLLRPLAFPDPEQLFELNTKYPNGTNNNMSPANLRDYRLSNHTASGLGALWRRSVNLVGKGEPRRLETARVTPDLMRTLGVGAYAGRVISPEDSVDGRVVVLSYGLWRTHFGGDRGIIGASVQLEGEPYTVIGVMPPSFMFPSRETEAWTALILTEANYVDRSDTFLEVYGRLRPGVSFEQARKDFGVIGARLAKDYPNDNADSGALLLGMRDKLSPNARVLVLALCGAALCILLLACANLASLLIARATSRARELAVRAALGAGPERLVRQLITESMGLAVLGGLVGIGAAIAGLPLLARLVPNTLPIAELPSIDARVLLLAAVFVLITGLAFGVGPSLGASRSRALDALREGIRGGGGRTRRVRAGLVVVEVAASVVLLVMSGLLIRAVLRIQANDLGFRAENVLTLRTQLPYPKYAITARRDQFYARVLENIRALPGVQSAAYVTALPMVMKGGIWSFSQVDGVELKDASNGVAFRTLTPQYFATLSIPLRAGRDVSDADTREAPAVMVISQLAAAKYWPKQNPLGKRATIGGVERTVVGVVGDVRTRGPEQSSEPQVYIPAKQMPDSSFMSYPPKELAVRTSAPTATILPAIRRIIYEADPEQAISNVRTMREIVEKETASRVTQLRVLGALSLIALLIAGIGIHGLLTFTVSRRSHELGVRRALGEQATSILRRVLQEGMVLALAGVVVGVVLAYFSARTIDALLYGIKPSDPLTFSAAAMLCFVVAVLGCLRPAIRASRIDPITALRGE